MTENRFESTLDGNSVPAKTNSPVAFILIVSATLFALTTLVYWHACRNGFVEWDDNHYVYQQPQVQNGLSLKGVVWAATAQVAANWHPLTLLSLQLDASLFGKEPFGFHRTSVLLHSLNSVLAFLAVLALTGCRWKSVLTACLFAFHPMHVESVAWISERKDVLSGMFFFFTLIAYAFYVKKPSIGRYSLVAMFLALGLCSKSMLVTVPCVLLLLDYWPLGRLGDGSQTRVYRLGQLCLEKLPLFVLVALVCVVTIKYQKNAIQPLSRLSFDARFENTFVSYVAYLYQTFWPLELSPYYARHAIPASRFWGAAVVLMILTALALKEFQRRPYLIVGWLWFVGMLVPVIGLFQVGHHARADRYMYLPQVGLFIALVWLGAEFARRSQLLSVLSKVLSVVLIAGCVFLTLFQISIWHDTKTLFQAAKRIDPNNPLATYILAEKLYGEGNRAETVKMVRQAIQVEDRADCETLIMLGMLMADCGEYDDCIQALDKALKSHPDDAAVVNNRAKALSAQGKWQEAVDGYRRASELAPDATNYRFNLAYALGKNGNLEESRKISAAALKVLPNWPQSIAAKAWKMSTSPNPNDRGHFWPVCLAEQACELTGGNRPEYLDVLAAAYAESGRFEEAIATAERAIAEAEKLQNKAYVDALQIRLKLYRKHEPYRERAI